MDKYLKAIKILENHYENHNSLKGDDYSSLIEMFPQFVLEQIAYRAIILKPLQDVKEYFLSEPNRSWALTLSGIKTFLTNEDIDGTWSETDQVHIYQAMIKGFDVASFVKHIVSLELTDSAQGKKFFEEQEIVAIEVKNVMFLNTIQFKDYENIV